MGSGSGFRMAVGEVYVDDGAEREEDVDGGGMAGVGTEVRGG